MEERHPGGGHRGPGVSRTRGALLGAGLAEGHLGEAARLYVDLQDLAFRL